MQWTQHLHTLQRLGVSDVGGRACCLQDVFRVKDVEFQFYDFMFDFLGGGFREGLDQLVAEGRVWVSVFGSNCGIGRALIIIRFSEKKHARNFTGRKHTQATSLYPALSCFICCPYRRHGCFAKCPDPLNS